MSRSLETEPEAALFHQHALARSACQRLHFVSKFLKDGLGFGDSTVCGRTRQESAIIHTCLSIAASTRTMTTLTRLLLRGALLVNAGIIVCSRFALASSDVPANWTIKPIATHPCLIFGPEDKGRLIERLSHEMSLSGLIIDRDLQVYLQGDEPAKRKATRDFISYWKGYATRWRKDNLEDRPEWIDGVALRGIRRTLMVYDVVASFGYLSREDTLEYRNALVRAVEFAIGHDSKHPRITISAPFRTMNIWTDTVAAAGLVGLAFPELPQAHDWVDFAIREIDQQLDLYVWDGCWHESPRYHCAMIDITGTFFHVLQRRTGIDLFPNPKFKAMLYWPTRFQTPLDRVAGTTIGHPEGVALLPGIGDASWVAYSFAVPALFASHYTTTDPSLAGHIMWSWQRAGRPWDGDSVEWSRVLIDPTIRPVPVDLGSDISRGKGYILMRTGFDTSNEVWFLLRCGNATRSTYHDHADWNSFNLYAYGAPLALDSASGQYSDPSHLHWNDRAVAHNTVVFGQRSQDRRDGRILEWTSRPSLDYSVTDATLAADVGKFIRHVLFIKPSYFVIWDEIQSIDPAEWMLHTTATHFEWTDHTVRCSTPWAADLSVQVIWPTTPLQRGTQKGKYSDWTEKQTQRDIHPFKYQDYFSIPAPPSTDYLVVLQPLKPGSPALTIVDHSRPGHPNLEISVGGRTDSISLEPHAADVRIGQGPVEHLDQDPAF